MSTYDSDTSMTVRGVAGRLTHRTIRPDRPDLWFHQRWISEARPIAGYGAGATLRVEMRFDDECRNGHATFAITAEVRRPRQRDCEACGCLHDEIAAVFSELAPLIKWHLTSTDGPMHYLANTIYHAAPLQDRWGKRAGERNLDHARSSAVWPEATDEELSADPAVLRAALEARLPALIEAFRHDMEACGFWWAPPAEPVRATA